MNLFIYLNIYLIIDDNKLIICVNFKIYINYIIYILILKIKTIIKIK